MRLWVSEEQNTIRQEVKAKEYNIPRECVYIANVSGKNVTERPVLTNLIASIKNGDKLIVDSISRFARNTKDLLELVEQLNRKVVTEGKYKGRNSVEIPKLWNKYYKMYKENTIKAVDVMKILELKKTTFYKLINQHKKTII